MWVPASFNCARLANCLLVFVALATVLESNSQAQTQGEIAVRQQEMKEIASAAKSIAAMFKSPETYSSQLFKLAANKISERAGPRLISHFEIVVSSEHSKATNAIATDHARFEKLAADLKAYADVLAKSAAEHPNGMTDDMRMKDEELMEGGILGSRRKVDVAAMSAEHAFHMMLQTCTSCHSTFRAK